MSNAYTASASDDPYDKFTVSVDVPEDGSIDWLDTLPTSDSGLPGGLFIPIPAPDASGETVTLSCRVPVHWVVMLETVRQLPGTMLPNLWPKRSDFLKFCYLLGMQRAREIAKALNGGEVVSEDIQARIFVENTAGKVAARADVMTSARDTLDRVAGACMSLINMGEPIEASNMLVEWINAALAQESAFWRSYFGKLIFGSQDVRTALSYLIQNGHLHDENIIEMCEEGDLLNASDDARAAYFRQREALGIDDYDVDLDGI